MTAGLNPILPSESSGEQQRRASKRLSGAEWQPQLEIPTGEFAGTVALPQPVPKTRKERRKRWYRRPRYVVPLLLLVLVAGGAGAVLFRAGSTIAELQSMSTPPPAVTTQDDDTAPAVEIDTAPAQAALQEAGVAPEQNGLFGQFKARAGDVGDAAGGAAAAAGLTDGGTGTINVLVMGVDARPGAPIDIAVKPDALLVLHLDPAAATCRVLSIPRDTRAELPGYGQSKINHALLVGGIPYQQLVVENLLGLQIDYYALIDFPGFQSLVDAVGGVPVNVPADVTVSGGIELKAGNQILDGTKALAYARYRADADGDIGRIKRQWAIIGGLSDVAGARDLLGDINKLLPAVEQHIRTNLSTAQLSAIAKTFSGNCTEASMETFALDGTRVKFDDPMLKQSVYYNVVDAPVIQERVAALLGEGD